MNRYETSRYNLFKETVLGIIALLLCSSIVHTNEIKSDIKKPNIIFILADDMGWSDLGCYGGEIETPNLDRLAYNGIRFTQMHNTAKCFPSRACLLSGVYAQQCGMDKKPASFKNSVTLGNVLKSGGYRTLASGKHHSTDNLYDQGFDHYYGLRDGACNYFNPGYPREGEGIPAQKQPGRRNWCIDDKTFRPYTPEEKDFYTTDYFTNYALQYLDQYKDETKPFFLYLAYNAPHDPLQAWPEDIKKYEDRYLSGWEKLREERYQRQLTLGLVDASAPISPPSYQDWESLSAEERKKSSRKMAVYAAMVDRLDQNVGRLLKKIKEVGKDKNTLILFASDNGCSAEIARAQTESGEIGSMTRWSSLGGDWANASNTPYRYYKNYSHEGGICTPFIAYWPGVIKAGRISHHPGHFIDIMPTFMEISGAPYPGTHNNQTIVPYEGESLLPVFQAQERSRTKPIFWQWSDGKAVLKRKWKLVSWKGEWELFDMEKDRTETTNLAKEYPQIVSEFKALHEKWVLYCAKFQ
jgi:arylsulfatase A-like enzyme